jgi:ABC-type uncharacterized transport system substrate-binding protein
MNKVSYIILIWVLFTSFSYAQEIKTKRILYVNSYHSGLAWSDGITQAIKNSFDSLKVDLKIFEMDTKRNKSQEYMNRIALQAKNEIEKFNPDIVITSDDNAAKYLIVPYFYNSDLPFVFCGVNWDASAYGFPTKNVGYLKGDSLSSRKEVEFFEKALHVEIDKRFVNSIAEWKSQFLALQKEVDILLLGNGSAIENWDNKLKNTKDFVLKNTEIPSAGWDKVMNELVLVTYATKPEEQGEWASKIALRVLAGEDISTIKLAKNKKAKSYINTTLLKKLNVVFPYEIIEQATLVK